MDAAERNSAPNRKRLWNADQSLDYLSRRQSFSNQYGVLSIIGRVVCNYAAQPEADLLNYVERELSTSIRRQLAGDHQLHGKQDQSPLGWPRDQSSRVHSGQFGEHAEPPCPDSAEFCAGFADRVAANCRRRRQRKL